MDEEGYQVVEPGEETVRADTPASLALATPSVVEEDRLSLLDATKKTFATISPFLLSRMMNAGQSFGSAVIINYSIPEATFAAPVMFMVQMAVMGAVRGTLTTINTIGSKLNGQSRFEQIGPSINQGLVLGTVLGVPTTVLFFCSRRWLVALGTDPKVAELTSQYLKGVSYGVLPTYWGMVDQQFYLSIKRQYTPIALSFFMMSSSIAISYALSSTELKLAGLGYGISAGAALTWVFTRAYMYFNKHQGFEDRHKYQLFCCRLNSGTDSKELLGLAVSTTLRSVGEWLPTTLISMLTANSANAQNNLLAEDPAMQVLVMINQILLGLATAAIVSVGNLLGRASEFAQKNQPANEWICQSNARTQGYANMIVTTLIILPLALLCMVYPNPLIWLFVNNPQTVARAASVLRLTGATLLIDGIRYAATGAILGKKNIADNFSISLINFFVIGAPTAALGYVTQKSLGSLGYFVFRLAGIAAATLLILSRWDKGIKPEGVPPSPALAPQGSWTVFKASENTRAVTDPALPVLIEEGRAVSFLRV